MRRHLLLMLLVAAAAMAAVQAIPIELDDSDSDSELTPIDSAAAAVESEAPGSQRQGRFLLLKLLAAKLLGVGAAKKKAVAVTAGAAGVASTAGVAGLAGAGPVYVDAGLNTGLGSQHLVAVDGGYLGGSQGVVTLDAGHSGGGVVASHPLHSGGVVAVDGGFSGGYGSPGVVSVDGGFSGGYGSPGVVSVDGGFSGGYGSPGVVSVDGGFSGGYGSPGIVSVDAGLSGGSPGLVAVNAAHGGLTNTGIVGVIQVPDKVQEQEGFFTTALRLPGLAVSSIVDTASSTASSIQSAASTVLSLPVKAGQAIVSTLDGVVNSYIAGSTNGPEYAVGEDYVPSELVYKETTVVNRPHHIILPIVVKGLHHGAEPAHVPYGDPIPVEHQYDGQSGHNVI